MYICVVIMFVGDRCRRTPAGRWAAGASAAGQRGVHTYLSIYIYIYMCIYVYVYMYTYVHVYYHYYYPQTPG